MKIRKASNLAVKIGVWYPYYQSQFILFSAPPVAPIDDPSEPGATLEECAASCKESSRSDTPTSLCDYDSESTLSNTSDFGSNIKYNLDYVFSQMSTRNLPNQLQSELESSKTSKASDAPSSSSDSANGKQHSFKRKKKKTTSSLLVSPPVILVSQLEAI